MDLSSTFFDTDKFVNTNKKLGKGSFGEVYVVKDKVENIEYAAKIIDTQKVFSGQDQMMFLRESLILHTLNHPAIVKFYGINLHEFNNATILHPTILTEYLENGALKQILDNEKKSIADDNWNCTKKFICLLGISDALRYLHKMGILHRDLKPENILVDQNYYPRVCDFGLSKCFSRSLSKSIQLSMSGKIGTPLYMAPEIFEDERKCGPSVDVYAFGMIAYEIFTGNEPFNENGHQISLLNLIQKISNGFLPKFPERFPCKMKNLILRCICRDPEQRPSFDDIFNELSNNISYPDYVDETIDEEEINQYLEYLDEMNNERHNKVTLNVSEMNMTLQDEIKQLKMKIEKYESNLNSFVISQDDLIMAFHNLYGRKKERNSVEAISNLTKSSQKGNKFASYLLGLIYENGEGSICNFEKAKYYYTKSANQGNSHGFNRIGLCFNGYCGCEQNFLKAKEYYEKGIMLGNPFSFYNLASLYLNGKGVDQDYSKAIDYFKKAAQLGLSKAFHKLGQIFLTGDNILQDEILTIDYFQKSADLDRINEYFEFEKLYEKRKLDKEFFTNELEHEIPLLYYQLGWFYLKLGSVENLFKAIEYFQKAAKLGVPEAFYEIGRLYEDGIGVKKDITKAKECYQIAIEYDVPEAFCQLGWLYLNGKGVIQDFQKALDYYQKAANLNAPIAFYEIGWIYLEGKGVKQNYEKATQYYLKAADLNVPLAFYQLGWIYSENKIANSNLTTAIKYYKKAAEFCVPEAYYSLGLIFEEGTGVAQNIQVAIKYYQNAAKLGFGDAEEKINKLNKKRKTFFSKWFSF